MLTESLPIVNGQVLSEGRGLIRRLIADRQRRYDHFPAELCTGPAWAMLLALADSTRTGHHDTVTSLCAAAYTPMSTGLRCIERLQKQGMAERVRHPRDLRVSIVRLTPEGIQRWAKYLASAAAANDFDGPLRRAMV